VWCRPSAFVDNLHVLPSMRSRGTGTALMRAAVDGLIAQGHSTAYLWVFEENVAAIRFYERLGAVTTGRARKAFFGQRVPCVRMEWTDLRAIGVGGQ
jgi:ribosomal protein S18 acetylase RimI-like enzyme